MNTWKIIIPAVAVLAAGAAVYSMSAGKKTSSAATTQHYDFATVTRSSLESDVTSSGTLGVVNSVSVLAQMSGRIESLNVDYNSKVRKGEVLATVNTDMLKLGERAAQAAVDKSQANYDLQVLAVQNAQTLAAKGLLSDYDLKTAQATLSQARADLDSAKASLEQIQTEINQYAFITAPINGIVLQRLIDLGQSVVGGGSATSTPLFTLTDDLSKMEIDAQVDELDISAIKAGQEVHFSVEAYPGEVFAGTVKSIRLLPTTTNNVVNYDVMIDAGNRSGKLLPGMTASISFVKQKKQNVLVVPNAALRFTPPGLDAAEIRKAEYLAGLGSLTPEQKAAASARYDAEQKAAADSGGAKTAAGGLTSLMGGARMGGPGFGGPPPGAALAGGSARTSASAPAGSGQSSSTQTAVAKKPLWYLDDSGNLAVMMVEPGISDGLSTELVGADSLEGAKVIVKVKVN
ncbi:MAG TPA: efflux RND transporter periplasmic adaptor subunit [Rectinemataceae bacterium]|nr:efflux RND transporter periplasmic adaptor subunit [Rectinemataceae bacterium]